VRRNCSASSRKDGKWAFRVKAANGEVVATDGGQGYSSKAGTKSTLEKLLRTTAPSKRYKAAASPSDPADPTHRLWRHLRSNHRHGRLHDAKHPPQGGVRQWGVGAGSDPPDSRQ